MKEGHIDRTLLIVVALLIVGGILIFFSASLSLVPRGADSIGGAILSQLVLGLGGGLVALYVALQTPRQLLRRFAPHFFILATVLTLLVFVPGLGVEANGARRWLDLGVTTFQPAELLKLAYVLLLATFLAKGKNIGDHLQKGIVPFIAMTGIAGAALLIQPDTDTFLVMAAAGLAMMFAAGMRLKYIAAFALVAIILLGGLIALRPYLLDRVETYLDASRDPQGSGYQIQQSLIAVGSGEFWGRGFGQSIQKFNYLPEPASDSIFAVYAEEFGFLGSALLVFGFLFLILRGMWVAARAEDYFGGLLVVGIVSIIGIQAFLNIAAMVALLPVGGLPLPFVSHGGSALLMALLMVGIVLSISRTVREWLGHFV